MPKLFAPQTPLLVTGPGACQKEQTVLILKEKREGFVASGKEDGACWFTIGRDGLVLGAANQQVACMRLAACSRISVEGHQFNFEVRPCTVFKGVRLSVVVAHRFILRAIKLRTRTRSRNCSHQHKSTGSCGTPRQECVSHSHSVAIYRLKSIHWLEFQLTSASQQSSTCSAIKELGL